MGVEKISPLVGIMQEYGDGYKEGGAGRGRGRNPDTDSVRIIHHKKRPERRIIVSTEGGGLGQPGPERPNCRCYGRADPTLWMSGGVLPSTPTVIGRSNP